MPDYKPTRVSGPPVDGFPLTLAYLATWPPYYTEARPHLGRDYGCPDKTPVKNPYLNPVRVKAVHLVDAQNKPLDGWGDGTLGNICILDMEDTEFFGGFAHMSRIDVKPDQVLSPGQLIGLSGASGFVDGAHLHWQHSADVNFSRSAKTEDPMSGLVGTVTLVDVNNSLTNLSNVVGADRLAGIARDEAMARELAGIAKTNLDILKALGALSNALPKG